MAEMMMRVGCLVRAACVAEMLTTFRRTTSRSAGGVPTISMNGSPAYASRQIASGLSSVRVMGTVIVARIPRATGRRCGVNTMSA
jgi:hypothetical protein